MKLLCKLGIHNWSSNHNGIRICLKCPVVDRYYSVSGNLRRAQEEKTGKKESDAELREQWIKDRQHHYDLRYMVMAAEASAKSTCAKKQLGCVLVLKNNDIVLSGANGPPKGLKKCDPCPRMESHNGTDLHKCRAVHAERQPLLKAAHHGLSTCGSTLYSYMGVPCKDCMLELWEAGVAEIVVIKETYYDELSRTILKEWIDRGGKFRAVEC
jgi:dCMP deaminase